MKANPVEAVGAGGAGRYVLGGLMFHMKHQLKADERAGRQRTPQTSTLYCRAILVAPSARLRPFRNYYRTFWGGLTASALMYDKRVTGKVTRRELAFTAIGAFVATTRDRCIRGDHAVEVNSGGHLCCPCGTFDEQIAELILYGTGENLPMGFLDCSNYLATSGGENT